MTFLFYFQPFIMDGYFITKNERSIRFRVKNEEKYKNIVDRWVL